MFVQNKYYTWYNSIIATANSKNRSKLTRTDPQYVYYESHHIKPESAFPELAKEKSNIVLLTAKEHFICHLLLCKCTTGTLKYKMIDAIIKMQFSKSRGQERYTSKSYAIVKHLMSDRNSHKFKGIPKSTNHKQKIGLGNTGKVRTVEYKDNFTKSVKQAWVDGKYDKLKQPRTEEVRAKIRATKAASPYIHTIESKILRAAQTAERHKILKECPYCNKSVSIIAFGHYHGTRCKQYTENK